MPSPRRVLSEADVRSFVEEQCFPVGTGLVGAELEWFVTGSVPHRVVEAACGRDFPGGSRLTFEPGGQVELSSPAGPLAAVWEGLATDRLVLRERLATVGAGMMASGTHPSRDPVRVLEQPRYAAMESFWSACGERDPGAGLAMMCTTASLQVNVDASLAASAADRDSRWRLAHALSPVLAACFANSPTARGAVTGWRSTRLGYWEGLDRTRTSPALRTGRAFDDWTAYLLDANVMLIRSGGSCTPLAQAFPMGRWIAEGHALGWPDREDLAYHVTTLFPPVRAKGWLELRSMDALGEPWWPVPIAVAVALMDDEEAADGAAGATGRASWCWCEAPRWALGYPALAEAARVCFTLARAALGRMGAPAALIGAVEAYQEQFVDRGLCPADREPVAV
jgi:glutamate--cysteine ligase